MIFCLKIEDPKSTICLWIEPSLILLTSSILLWAYSSSDSLFGESSQDEGIDGEDGLSHKEEWGDNQPEESSEESKIGPTISHQPPVRTGLEKCRKRTRAEFSQKSESCNLNFKETRQK